jgi:hypothetical protein
MSSAVMTRFIPSRMTGQTSRNRRTSQACLILENIRISGLWTASRELSRVSGRVASAEFVVRALQRLSPGKQPGREEPTMQRDYETIHELELRLDRIQAKIEALEDYVKNPSVQAIEELNERLDRLTMKRDQIEMRLDELKTEHFGMFGDARSGADFAMLGVKDALESMAQRLGYWH